MYGSKEKKEDTFLCIPTCQEEFERDATCLFGRPIPAKVNEKVQCRKESEMSDNCALPKKRKMSMLGTEKSIKSPFVENSPKGRTMIQSSAESSSDNYQRNKHKKLKRNDMEEKKRLAQDILAESIKSPFVENSPKGRTMIQSSAESSSDNYQRNKHKKLKRNDMEEKKSLGQDILAESIKSPFVENSPKGRTMIQSSAESSSDNYQRNKHKKLKRNDMEEKKRLGQDILADSIKSPFLESSVKDSTEIQSSPIPSDNNQREHKRNDVDEENRLGHDVLTDSIKSPFLESSVKDSTEIQSSPRPSDNNQREPKRNDVDEENRLRHDVLTDSIKSPFLESSVTDSTEIQSSPRPSDNNQREHKGNDVDEENRLGHDVLTESSKSSVVESSTKSPCSPGKTTFDSQSEHKKYDEEEIQIIVGDWSEQLSSAGKTYYYNFRTDVSQWEKPKELIEYEQQRNLSRLSEQQSSHNENPNEAASERREDADDSPPVPQSSETKELVIVLEDVRKDFEDGKYQGQENLSDLPEHQSSEGENSNEEERKEDENVAPPLPQSSQTKELRIVLEDIMKGKDFKDYKYQG